MQRQENESFEDYKIRRKKEQQTTKDKLKPRVFHVSRNMFGKGITYVRPKKAS